MRPSRAQTEIGYTVLYYNSKRTFGSTEYYFDYFIKNAGIKESSRSVYMSYYYRHIYPFFYDRQLDSITYDDLTAFWNDLYEQGFYTIAGGIYDMLHRFFQFLNNSGIHTPTLGRKSLELRRYYPEHSARILKSDIKAIKASDRYPQAVLILLIAACCGIKRQEALSIRKTDIDLQNSLLILRSPDAVYSHRARIIKFPKDLQKYFLAVMEEDYGSEFLFENNKGKQLCDADIGYRIRALKKYIKCQTDITYQSCRQYYASTIDEKGGNRLAAESIMGICGAHVRLWHRPVTVEESRRCSDVLCDFIKEFTDGSNHLLQFQRLL